MRPRLKHLMRMQYGSALSAELREDGYCTVYGSNGAVGSHIARNTKQPAIIVGRKGSFGKVTWAEQGGFCIDTAYFVDERYCNGDLRFSYYALINLRLDEQSKDSTVPGLDRNDAQIRHINIPDLTTQRAIADFLDRETARIDTLIEKKQRLLELLGEKSFAFVEDRTFIGDIQEEERIPFRWVCRIAEGQVDPTSDIWRDRTLIAPNHIESKTGRLLAMETAEEQGAISGKYAYSAGTVLYSKIRPALAKACIAPEAGMCSADMYPIVPDHRLRPEYLLMQLLSARFTEWATLESMRVAMPKINRETLGNFRLRVPPLPMQDGYIQEYSSETKRFDAISISVRASSDRLKEYRSALITAAVTGQIDVTEYRRSGMTERHVDTIEEAASA